MKNKERPVIKLIGKDGNAFNILALAIQALKNAGYSSKDIEKYRDEATNGDYNNLLRITSKWVEIA